MTEAEIRRDERHKVAALLDEHAESFVLFADEPLRVVNLIAFMLRLDRDDGRGAPETGADVAASPTDTPPTQTKKAKADAVVSTRCTCGDCGREFANMHGLTVHKARVHREPERGGEPAPDTTPGRDWLLRCEDCDFTCGPEETVAMRRHTINAHDGRLPSNVERTPSVA